MSEPVWWRYAESGNARELVLCDIDRVNLTRGWWEGYVGGMGRLVGDRS